MSNLKRNGRAREADGRARKMAWMLRSFLQGDGVVPDRKSSRARVAAYA